MDVLVARLEARLREWKPETAAQVRECMTEVIELADQDLLDLVRPHATFESDWYDRRVLDRTIRTDRADGRVSGAVLAALS